MTEKIKQLKGNIGKVIVGKEETIELLLTALLSDGHVLLEDVPGTGKTKLARTIAASIGTTFSRIQFTPDLLPTDLTGMYVFRQQEGNFELRKGPVFTNILLADEINRATPRTQSGLLECMEEHQVTIDGEKMVLEDPFMVLATQNPVETTGTFPLPEAQLDRFMMKLSMGVPAFEEEVRILNRFMGKDPIEEIPVVMTKEELLALKKQAEGVFVHSSIVEYIARVVEATRNQTELLMGVSTRGSLAMLRAAKAYALLQNRSYVIPDDVAHLAVPVFAHRIVLSYGMGQEREKEKMIQRCLETVPVPTEEFGK